MKTPKASTSKDCKKITQFFSKGESSTVANIEKNQTDDISNFYKSSINGESKRNKCDDRACALEKRELEQQLAQSKAKLAQTKGAIDTCKRILQQKDVKLNFLRGQLNEQRQTVNQKESEEFYNNYKNDFTAAGLSELRSIGGRKNEDSSFVLSGMRYLYHNQLDRLGKITVTGGCKKNSKKNANVNIEKNEKMSPRKLEAIKGAFTERLNILQLEEKERKQRAGRINVLINNAIQNINPTKNQKRGLHELNQQINSAEMNE